MSSCGSRELVDRAWAASEQVRKSQARSGVHRSRPPDRNPHLDDLDVRESLPFERRTHRKEGLSLLALGSWRLLASWQIVESGLGAVKHQSPREHISLHAALHCWLRIGCSRIALEFALEALSVTACRIVSLVQELKSSEPRWCTPWCAG